MVTAQALQCTPNSCQVRGEAQAHCALAKQMLTQTSLAPMAKCAHLARGTLVAAAALQAVANHGATGLANSKLLLMPCSSVPVQLRKALRLHGLDQVPGGAARIRTLQLHMRILEYVAHALQCTCCNSNNTKHSHLQCATVTVLQ